MALLGTVLQSIAAALNWNVRVNDNFEATSAAGMYGKRAAATSSLTWGYYGGRGFGNTIADGTVALTASSTNYVVANRSTGAVSVSTSSTNWNDSTNYYRLFLLVTGASTVTTATDYREFVGGGSGSSFTGGTLTSALNEAPPATIASASTVNIGAAASNTVIVTGTTTITGFDAIAAGAIRRVRFTGILTLTHNGTSLILPGSASITTAVGDVATFESLGSGNWRCIDYARADGTAVVGGGGGGSGTVTSISASGGVETTSGSAITASGTIQAATLVNAQSGTSYTYLTGDRGKLVTHSNASSIAATLPQATSTFGAGWFMRVRNKGAGTLTITPTTSTIDGAATLVLTTGQWAIVVSDGTNYQADVYAPSGGGGSLTGFTNALNTSSPNNTVNTSSLVASGGTTDQDVVIGPKGGGAVLARIPDGTATGGNKRGANATDLQTSRSTAAQVASGSASTIAGGRSNTASGNDATVAGGFGNSAATNSAVGGGDRNAAGGTGSCVPGGSGGTTRSEVGAMAFSSAGTSVGDGQYAVRVHRMRTTTATPTRMSSSGSTPAATTVPVVPSAAYFAYSIRVLGAVFITGTTAAWVLEGVVKNVGGTLTLVGTPVSRSIGADAGAAAWTATVQVNNTLKSIEVEVTGAASTTIDWRAVLETTEMTT